MKAIKTWYNHNQGMFAAILIAIVLLVWTYGCESKVSSIIEPQKQVTREELNLELDQESTRLQNELVLIQKQAELRYEKLNKDEEIKRQLMEFGALAAAGGGVNPAGLLGLLTGILGVGAVVDNRIKDKVIKNRPLQSLKA